MRSMTTGKVADSIQGRKLKFQRLHQAMSLRYLLSLYRVTRSFKSIVSGSDGFCYSLGSSKYKVKSFGQVIRTKIVLRLDFGNLTHIPFDIDIMIYNETKLKLNHEGCSNTLSEECTVFHRVFGQVMIGDAGFGWAAELKIKRSRCNVAIV